MSHLIYWMTLHTSLTVKERYRHSFDVFPDSNRSQPFGSGATCVYNYRDLMIKNTTSAPYQLCVEVKKEHLLGQWRALKPESYTYKAYEKNHEMRLEPWGGYTRHNEIYRQKIDCFGERIEDEYIAQNHAMMMYPAFLESKEV